MKFKILIIAALFLIVAILFSISIKSELKIIYPQNNTVVVAKEK